MAIELVRAHTRTYQQKKRLDAVRTKSHRASRSTLARAQQARNRHRDRHRCADTNMDPGPEIPEACNPKFLRSAIGTRTAKQFRKPTIRTHAVGAQRTALRRSDGRRLVQVCRRTQSGTRPSHVGVQRRPTRGVPDSLCDNSLRDNSLRDNSLRDNSLRDNSLCVQQVEARRPPNTTADKASQKSLHGSAGSKRG